MESNVSESLQYASVCDVGPVRSNNEDTVHCQQGLYLVADGMGGHACGEVASKMAAQIIATELNRQRALSDAIQTAHSRIRDEGINNPERHGMGSTVVALRSFAERFEISWVGDSRAYSWQPHKQSLTLITRDHSLVRQLLDSGVISAEQAQNHPHRHVITQCLGSVSKPKVDVESQTFDWLPGQQVLLCSDGLSDAVSEAAMSEILAADLTAQQKLDTLVAVAKSNGGKDNISAVLVEGPVGLA